MDLRMITEDLKVKVLKYLVDNHNNLTLQINPKQLAQHLQENEAFVNAVLEEYDNSRLISLKRLSLGRYICTLRSRIFDVYNKLEEPKAQDMAQVSPEFTLDVFISHSAVDVDIAKAVIDLIEKALKLKSEKIRCTSVSGYKLETGADTIHQLKGEIFSSRIFIGIITEHSLESTFVLFELGARWGSRLPLFPLVCSPKDASLLKSPLNAINAMVASNEADLHQFINDVAKKLDVQIENANVYLNEIRALQTVSSSAANVIPSAKANNSQRAMKAKFEANTEYPNAEQIIKEESVTEWPDNFTMQLHFIKDQLAALEELMKGKPSAIEEAVFERIRMHARKEWPRNYVMQLHTERDQIESVRKLNEA
jgi:hypothetical protein